jgi:hypothetical protein
MLQGREACFKLRTEKREWIFSAEDEKTAKVCVFFFFFVSVCFNASRSDLRSDVTTQEWLECMKSVGAKLKPPE